MSSSHTRSLRARLHRLAVALRDVVLFVLDGAATATVARQSTEQAAVACVRLDALGDMVLWLDAARAIRRGFDGRRQVLICEEAQASLARSTGLWDEVIPVSATRLRKQPMYRLRTLRRLARESFETVLHPVYSREGDFADGEAVVRALRAREKVGLALLAPGRGWRARLADRTYTRLIPTAPGTLMELRRNADFVRGIGQAAFRASVPEMSVMPAPDDAPYFVLFPGAGLSHRRWPVDRFAQIAKRLHHQTGWRGIVCGGPGERELADQLVTRAGDFVESAAGRTDLQSFVRMIAGAELVISNDTSATHIAAASGTPVVCVVGGGEPGRFLPYDIEAPARSPLPLPVRQPVSCEGCNWHCVHKIEGDAPFPCIDQIGVEAVWRAIEQVLREQNSNEPSGVEVGAR